MSRRDLTNVEEAFAHPHTMQMHAHTPLTRATHNRWV